MTWVKLGAEFNSECALQGLSDAAYRTHSEAIGWLYEVEDTSCRIPKRLFRRFAASDGAEAAVEELIAASFWKDAGAVWVLVHHASVIRQSIAAQQDKRKRDQKAQRRYRQKVSADVSADVNDESAATQSDRQTVGRKTTAAAKNNYQDQDQGQKKASGGGAAGQEEAAAGPARVDPSAANSEDHRVHDGPDSSGSDDQQIPIAVLHQSQAADRNAREGDRPAGTRPATLQRREDLKQRVASYIAAKPGCSGNELQAAIGGHRDNMLTVLRQLIDDGQVIRIRDPEDRRVCRYTTAGSTP